jgi:hypothetical protein
MNNTHTNTHNPLFEVIQEQQTATITHYKKKSQSNSEKHSGT